MMVNHHALQDNFISAAFQTFLNSTKDIVFLKDNDFVYRSVSQAFVTLTGKGDSSQILGKTDFEVFDNQELAMRYRDDDRRLLALGEPLLDYIEPIPGKDGSYAYSSTCKYIIHDAHGNAIGLWGIARDVTHVYQARIHYERELQHLFEMPESALTTVLFDITGWRVVDFRTKIGHSPAMSSFSTIDTFLAHVSEFVLEGDEARTFFTTSSQQSLQDFYNSGKRHFSVEYLRRLPDGAALWVRSEMHFLADPVNGRLSLLIILLDIDEEHRSRDTLTRAADHDAMTGLLNREATMRRIALYLQAEGLEQGYALFLIDLDNFKQVNDTFGHPMGDSVLVQVATLIRLNFRDSDIVGRVGGDEFFALMKHAETPEAVHAKAQSLVAALQYVCTAPSAAVELSSSVGVSISAAGEKELSTLYAEADSALYEAKRAGKNRFSVFRYPLSARSTAPMASTSASAVNLHTLLNKIDAGVIIFHFSPDDAFPRPLFFSNSLLALMGGLTREEAHMLFNKPALDSVHPDDLDRVYAEACSAFLSNSLLRTTFRNRGKNNAYFWVSIGVTFTLHDDGSYDVYSVYTSVDSLMQTEAELREKTRVLDVAMKNTDINVWFWDMHTKLCTLSPNCQTVHGMPVDTLEHFPECLFLDHYVREDCEQLMREKFAQLENGAPEVTYDSWYRNNNGVGYWCERVVLTALLDDTGKPVRAIGIGKNVTAAKEFEQKYRAIKNGLRPLAGGVGPCIVNLTVNACTEGEGCTSCHVQSESADTADAFFNAVTQQMVREDDRAQAAQLFSRSALLAQHASGQLAVSLDFLSSGYGDLYKWIRATVELMESPETGEIEALISFVDIDQEKRLQLTTEKLLTSDYELLCQIDAKTGRFILFAEQQDTQMLPHDAAATFDDAIPSFVHAFVPEEYWVECLYGMRLSTVVRELAAKPLYTCSFANKATDTLREGYRQWRFSYLDETQLVILITRTDITDLFFAESDPLTGLFNRQAFYRYVRQRLTENPAGNYTIIRCDLDRFKAYNDAFGIKAGDRLLGDFAKGLCDTSENDGAFWARLDADHFVAFWPDTPARIEQWAQQISQWLSQYSPTFRLTASVGIYCIADPGIDVSFMCDRALLALKTVKNRYDTALGWYDDSLRSRLIEEQLLIDATDEALRQEQFVVYYQPQINYTDGSLIGAEALVRWLHPHRGLLSPGAFIPLFEKNGFISRLDECVWEQVCRYMRRWSDEKQRCFPVPISVNLSRINLYDQALCDKLCALIDRYALTRAMLRLEITESAYMDNPEQLISVVKQLKHLGFTVEMDDFGSGYSSLNTLKDVPVDVLKLDVRFLNSGEDNARGGNILGSVVRMAHWLKIPMVAEGVETKFQADYLNSLSCFYMQGYYFSHPVPETHFTQMLDEFLLGNADRFVGADLAGADEFWDPAAQNTLLFNRFLGGAIIVEYYHGVAELLRANDRFFEEIGATRESYLAHQFNLLARFDDAGRAQYLAMLTAALDTTDEVQCEVRSLPLSPDSSVYWTRNCARLLAKNEDRAILYVGVQNITATKQLQQELAAAQAQLKACQSERARHP